LSTHIVVRCAYRISPDARILVANLGKCYYDNYLCLVSRIAKMDRCKMPMPSLPAASLRGRIRLPAQRGFKAANDMICLVLCSIVEAIFGFSPCSQGGRAGERRPSLH